MKHFPLLALLVSLYLSACSESAQWHTTVVSVDGERVDVGIFHRGDRQLGAGHVIFYYDDSTYRWKVNFPYKGREYVWDERLHPILLSLSPAHPPIISTIQGRGESESEYGTGNTVRFFRAEAEDRWIEFSRLQYPKDIVLPNLDHSVLGLHYIPGLADWREFPNNVNRTHGTIFVALWQALCGISDAALPFLSKADQPCLDQLKATAELQFKRENG